MNRKTNKESYSIRKKSFIYLCTQIEADLENLDVKNKSLKVKILKYKLLKQQSITFEYIKSHKITYNYSNGIKAKFGE